MTRTFRTAPLAAVLAVLLVSPAYAQPAPSAEAARDWPQVEPDRPWIYRGSDVPPDPEWQFGELSNGLRYAVRFNEVPQEQLSIRVRIDAGSLHERDGERGFAHLLEHLLFRESRYLKEGETIPKWENLGATFGSDTNAETTPTHTVYKLDVPDMNPTKLDETFKLLSGMVEGPTLTEKGVRTEVPIVLAEMRERGGAGKRVADATRETYFNGMKLAVRSPIGTVETLNAANQQNVRAFYNRWYRPENTVITVAGDVAPAVMVQMLEKYFGGWKGKGAWTPAPDFGDPVPGANAKAAAGALAPVDKLTVLDEPDLPISINYAILRPWEKVADTIEYNEGLLTNQLSMAIINRRLENRARAGGSYLAAQVGQDDVSRSTDATFVSITPLGDDWKGALTDVRAVISDALANPPGEDEIAREFAEFENAFRVGVETQEVQQAADLANNVVQAVDIRETVAAPDTVLKVLSGMRGKVTPDAILSHTRALFTGPVLRGVMTVPQASMADEAAFRAAMVAPVQADASARVQAKAISFADLPSLGTPGTVSEAVPTGILEVERLTLSNGTKLLIWPNDAEPGRVSVRVRFGDGYEAFGKDDAPYIALGEFALMGTGIGPLSQDDLDQVSNGRKMGLDFSIEDGEFVMGAETRAADLEDQLYLFAAKLATPRWDANPVLRAKAALEMGYDTYSTSPNGVMQRDLEYILRGKDPRFATPTPAALKAADMAGFRKVWEPILASGALEVEIFGDVPRADAIAAVNKTFGALAPRSATTPKADLSKVPAPTAEPIFLTHRGDANQAAAVIGWPTGGGRQGIQVSRQLEILSQIFNNRLFDAMRERLGASYAPNVGSRWPLDRSDGGMILAMAQLQPEAVPAFFEESKKIAADLATTPPTAEEVSRVTEPLRQLIMRASSGNGFWLRELAGSAGDPSRLSAVPTILDDYSKTTPEAMQMLAQTFLANDRSFEVAIVPEEQGQ
ncbi:M16 family metallopeptidase [Croceicoccus naphthovorans]|uniref:Peptidase M16 n=1 Tax=Croceicoccus naphthovorans TaxID=1348774 RepID=A0A0G3XIR5_9SPHN|nr:M16 family metallopeptidase [Croceicoccus naphthovorans]AKM10511.1 peptidase M16 [Croceicoccus naphthovorans]MBB3988701.1 zinc protease [Croceicoccus naphthovorans]